MILSRTWEFTRNVTKDNLQTIPPNCKQFQMDLNSSVDLGVISNTPKKTLDECIIYNSFELKEDTPLAFGAGADWWFEAYLNGKMIYSTMAKGNEIYIVSANNHSFSAQGKAGKNLLAIMVKRNTGDWKFCLKEKSPESVNPVSPITITADVTQIIGKIKPMNAVNNGPIKARSDQTRGNMELWQEAKIPFARNHDSAFYSAYGGEHAVDVHAIFPDFSKDENDPNSYDFTLTDRYLSEIQEGDTRVFYRLGSKIEHAPKKYGTKVPPDFKKWAVICEHIIRHYTEGWANGFRWDIQYWEIWNEPDLSSGKADKKTWQGTDEQFFEFFQTAASYLKAKFPHLKIGGPALAGKREWMKTFLAAMTKDKRVPLDFFSWHWYGCHPMESKDMAYEIRCILDQYGYTKTESILNEWNYVRGWTANWIYSVKAMTGMKGAAFMGAVMSSCQQAPVDMLMYYDARPCAMNGLFDFYTLTPLKGYYPILIWSKFAALGYEFKVDTQEKIGLFATGATNKNGKIGILLSRFFENDNLPQELNITLKANGISLWGVKVYALNENQNLTEISYKTSVDGGIILSMPANTILYLEK